jgi:hypothetical protein
LKSSYDVVDARKKQRKMGQVRLKAGDKRTMCGEADKMERG